ncbi:MAG: hypothetical protein WCF90_01625 [Methanomicrobiales archaeon]
MRLFPLLVFLSQVRAVRVCGCTNPAPALVPTAATVPTSPPATGTFTGSVALGIIRLLYKAPDAI